MIFIALCVPFVMTDGAAHDLQARTHEMLMATALPTGPYVWGRFLARLGLTLGLAMVLLVAMLVLAFWRARETLPNVGALFGLWFLAMVPAIVFLSSIAFALGTLLPQRANLIKVIVIIGWFSSINLLGAIIDVGQRTPNFAPHVPYRMALAMIGVGFVAFAARRFVRFSTHL